ncbi:MAG: sensor domain-containing protein, partial [Gaiellaceae bacterium]
GPIERLTGLPAGALLSAGPGIAHFVHPEDAEAVARGLAEALAERRPYSLLYRMAHADGSVVWVRDLGQTSCDDRGVPEARTGLLMEATEQHETERALLEQATFLDALLQQTPDNIYFKDTLGRFLRVSAAQARWLGLPEADAAVGRTDSDFFAAEHAERAAADEREIIRTGKPMINTVERDVWKNGRLAWVSTAKMPLRSRSGEVIGTFGVSRDITRHRLTELAVHENEERMSALIATQRDAAFSGDVQGVLQMITTRASEITNADGAALLLLDDGKLLVRAGCGILGDAVGKRLDPSASGLERWLGDGLPRRFGDAQSRPEIAAAVAGLGEVRSLALAPIHHEQMVVGLLEVAAREPATFQAQDEEALELLSVIVTATLGQEELRQNARLAEHEALHDALTGLPNRVLFDDRVRQALRTAEREGGRVVVALLDLDRFKEINDTLGHTSGDRVLTRVARRLQACVRASDTVARLGGDEFGLLLLVDGIESAGLKRLLDKLVAAIERPIDLDGLPLGIEGSIGVAFFPDHGLTSQELIRRADVAMYAAKEDGRPYAFYEQAGDHHDPVRLTLVGDLRRAIDEGELILYYQPKVALTDGSVHSVEALLRWRHPDQGLTLIPPGEFIPQALETGLMKPLTRYVLDRALQQARAWHDDGLDLSVSINVGIRNLIDATFPDEVATALEQAGAEASWLEIEIPESAMLDEASRTKAILERLSAMGIRLSIDDFGTGYSSLSYLRRLPVSEIKIDRSFVLGMAGDADDAVIVRSTIDLARNLGLQVVAEGVESESVRDQLAELGCDFAQGFFLSPPVSAEELCAWMKNRGARPVS